MSFICTWCFINRWSVDWMLGMIDWIYITAPWKLHALFFSPRVHKQWTIPAYLLAELLLLYTPCLSESTHLEFNSKSKTNISNEFVFLHAMNLNWTQTNRRLPCPYIANHLCTKPSRISSKWRRKHSYSFWNVRWKKLAKLFLQPLCCITGYPLVSL